MILWNLDYCLGLLLEIVTVREDLSPVAVDISLVKKLLFG